MAWRPNLPARVRWPRHKVARYPKLRVKQTTEGLRSFHPLLSTIACASLDQHQRWRSQRNQGWKRHTQAICTSYQISMQLRIYLAVTALIPQQFN